MLDKERPPHESEGDVTLIEGLSKSIDVRGKEASYTAGARRGMYPNRQTGGSNPGAVDLHLPDVASCRIHTSCSIGELPRGGRMSSPHPRTAPAALLAAAVALCASASATQAPDLRAQPRGRLPLQVGEVVAHTVETPHPYGSGIAERGEVVTATMIHHPDATYIAPHFAQFELDAGDYVIVASPDGSRAFRYELSGKQGSDRASSGGFWGGHIAGDTAVIELHRSSAGKGYGYRIDSYARGYTDDEIAAKNPADTQDIESLCGPDDSNWAACYASSEPTIFERATPVARLLINGTSSCTGWLVGSEGHVLTNAHCIGSAADANNTDFEFDAQGGTCSASCTSQGTCPGIVEATSSTLVMSDVASDFALVQLGTNVTPTYGYLQLRAAGAIVNERIYIPQHPQGWGKRIAVVSSHPSDASGYGEVFGLNAPACQSGGLPDVSYFADTQSGSSGSPVIAYADHQVVALHHCGNCPNRGVPIGEVVTALGGSLPPCALPSSSCPSTVGTGVPSRECKKCRRDSDCKTPAICKRRKCVTDDSVTLGGECCRDVQCTTGSCNSSGVCQCTQDNQCPQGQYCAEGCLGIGKNTCVSFKAECDGCTLSSQCGPGALCKWGLCAKGNSVGIGGSCCRDYQCTTGSCNSSGVCQCTQDNQCPQGQYCAEGFLGIGKNTCVSLKAECDGCTLSSQCGSGALCKWGLCAKGSSVGIGGSCCRDYQCTTGSCNSSGVCQCTQDNQCPQGQYCAEGFLGIGKNTCVSFKAECDGCTLSSQCGPGALCRVFKCATHNSLSSGQSCCRDWQCTSGNCKSKGQCK